LGPFSDENRGKFFRVYTGFIYRVGATLSPANFFSKRGRFFSRRDLHYEILGGCLLSTERAGVQTPG